MTAKLEVKLINAKSSPSSRDVHWFVVTPGARTSFAPVRTSTQSCRATSTGSSEDAGTFSPTVTTEMAGFTGIRTSSLSAVGDRGGGWL